MIIWLIVGNELIQCWQRFAWAVRFIGNASHRFLEVSDILCQVRDQ